MKSKFSALKISRPVSRGSVEGLGDERSGDLKSVEESAGIEAVDFPHTVLQENLVECCAHTGGVLDRWQHYPVLLWAAEVCRKARDVVVIAEGFALESGSPAFVAAGQNMSGFEAYSQLLTSASPYIWSQVLYFQWLTEGTCGRYVISMHLAADMSKQRNLPKSAVQEQRARSCQTGVQVCMKSSFCDRFGSLFHCD
ncbi:MAG: hypothetical protein JST28_08195 [Acidobacteria bacterium]|nr:hypothetical protein [Acidobacteriota bacterium]